MVLFFPLLFFVRSAFGNIANDDRGLFFENHANKVMEIPLELNQNVTEKSTKVEDKMDCVFACTSERWCRSINYKTKPERDGKHVCELLSVDSFTGRNYVKENSSFVFMDIKNPCENSQCLNGGSCLVQGKLDYKCQCKAGCTGEHCEKDIDECLNKSHVCSSNEKCYNTMCSFKCINMTSQGCLTLYQNNIATQNGVYTLYDDKDNNYAAYCDMTNGGWTLAARFSNADSPNWMVDSGQWWYDVISGIGNTATPHVNQDMISPAFWTVKGKEFKITRSDYGSHTALLYTTSNCLNSTTFRSKITSFGNFRNDTIWGSDSCKGSCNVVYGGRFSTTRGFKTSFCDSNLQTRNKIGFWCDWSGGDGAVMMIGGGGDSCYRADHGIGITENNAASFVDGDSGEKDFGDDASKGTYTATHYSLNLWIR